MSTSPGLKIALVTLNSPNPPALAGFYSRLLGWEVGTEEPEWADLRNPDGGIGRASTSRASTSARCGPPSLGNSRSRLTSTSGWRI